MRGYAQTTKQLAGSPATLQLPEVSRRMTLISSEAERLSLMVGQILDVTRMEEGHMVMERVRCHVDEIIHAAVETHYPILNKNQNRLDIRVESGLPAVYADPARIAQVIINLIANAVRFTTDGVIIISAQREDSDILIGVSDNGIGIAANQLPQIFARYGKVQKSGGQDTGTGLGLYICKYIVGQHGGEIRIESVFDESEGLGYFALNYERDGEMRYVYANVEGWINSNDGSAWHYAGLVDCPEYQADEYWMLFTGVQDSRFDTD